MNPDLVQNENEPEVEKVSNLKDETFSSKLKSLVARLYAKDEAKIVGAVIAGAGMLAPSADAEMNKPIGSSVSVGAVSPENDSALPVDMITRCGWGAGVESVTQQNLDAEQALPALIEEVYTAQTELGVAWNYLTTLSRGAQKLPLPEIFAHDENPVEDSLDIVKLKERLRLPDIASIEPRHRLQYLDNFLLRQKQGLLEIEAEISERKATPLSDQVVFWGYPSGVFGSRELCDGVPEIDPLTPAKIYEEYQTLARTPFFTEGPLSSSLVKMTGDSALTPLPSFEEWVVAADTLLRHIRLHPDDTSARTLGAVEELFKDGVALEDLQINLTNKNNLYLLQNAHSEGCKDLMSDPHIREMLRNYIILERAAKFNLSVKTGDLSWRVLPDNISDKLMFKTPNGNFSLLGLKNYLSRKLRSTKNTRDESLKQAGIELYRIAQFSGIGVDREGHRLLLTPSDCLVQTVGYVLSERVKDTSPDSLTVEVIEQQVSSKFSQRFKEEVAALKLALQEANTANNGWAYREFLDDLEAVLYYHSFYGRY